MRDRPPRHHELDWLRFLAVVFVVALHLAQTFARAASDPMAHWNAQSALLGSVLTATSYFRMPVLFCVAGMVAVHTRGHRALGDYLRIRAERLLLPLLLGLVVLTPVQHALENQLTTDSRLQFSWGNFWFLGALVVITGCTLPVGVCLARPAVQARLMAEATRGRTLVLLAALPLVGVLLPIRWVGIAPVIGHVDVKTLVGYGGDFVAGMVLASAPAFRTTVLHWRRAALLAWALATAMHVLSPRIGVEGHLVVVVDGVASWAWVLACYGYAARYLAAPSPALARWSPRALAVYALHGVALAVGRCVVLPLDLPLVVQVVLLVAVTAGGTLALVRLAEGYRGSAEVLGLWYTPSAHAPLVLAKAALEAVRLARLAVPRPAPVDARERPTRGPVAA